MAESFERLRDPFALGRRLEQHARPRAAGEPRGEVLARALNPSFDHLALRRQDADLTFPLVDVAKRPRAQVLPEDPILLPEIRDQIVLMAVHPASERENEEL